MTPASRNALILATTGSVAALGWYLQQRRTSARPQPLHSARTIPIITETIDLGTAEQVLVAMERIPSDDELTLLLHTAGGSVAACVMIATALRRFERSTAIVPYLALSGGTLIALNAQNLQMGKDAALSAVDPVLDGVRVRHLSKASHERSASAAEYDRAMRAYLRHTIDRRIPHTSADHRGEVMKVFYGENAPHEWPILRIDMEMMGISVSDPHPMWGQIVEEIRGRGR
ncbi:MAG: hypothetical protein IPK80_20965 [Nannocystis sp.]|nr:hypothetical protein [Nannocystis sp.]